MQELRVWGRRRRSRRIKDLVGGVYLFFCVLMSVFVFAPPRDSEKEIKEGRVGKRGAFVVWTRVFKWGDYSVFLSSLLFMENSGECHSNLNFIRKYHIYPHILQTNITYKYILLLIY